MSLRSFPILALSLAFVVASDARADRITMGSDLSADATIVEAHGADTAFWPITLSGKAFEAPEDGQVLSVKIKGTVLKERGAADPATLIHIQSLEPAAGDGSRVVFLSSQGFDMPIDQPNTVTTFTPENLCIHKGGTVAFNNIGGFMYGGSLSAPLDQRHYLKGAPFQTFADVGSSSTARYTADNGTKNGATVYPQTVNQQPGAPAGTVNQGQELLLQFELATGNDRSEPCGGPRRHSDGSLVVPPPAMHIIGGQNPYVRKSGQLEPAIYCAGPSPCAGTAAIFRKGKVIATAPFSVKPASSGRIPMKISRKNVNALRRAAGKRLFVTFALDSPLGKFSKTFFIKN
jgi:hypothetical protein